MASHRAQIFAAVAAKLELARVELEWRSLIVNPREGTDSDQLNAIVFMHGGDRAPQGLSDHVDDRELEFSVGLVVAEGESGSSKAEDMLDDGYVEVVDRLIDPDDIQLGGLAVDIRLTGISDPMIGHAQDGAVIIGGQYFDFAVRYMSREGDASTVAP